MDTERIFDPEPTGRARPVPRSDAAKAIGGRFP
jgi:hypothetical protein